MAIILKHLTLENFANDYKCSPDTDDSFKIYTLFEDGKRNIAVDIKDLEVNDRNDARKALIKLLANAKTGQPFHNIFDGNQYHTGHEFVHHDSLKKIWRLRLAGDIRIYFIYLPNRVIVVLKILAKRINDLNSAEKLRLEELAKRVLTCSETESLTLIEDKK